jgi:acyl carrier protein
LVAGTRSEIRRVVREHAHLARDVDALSDQADLFTAGMTSHASINVMLALEEVFHVEFPEIMLRREVFVSIDAMAAAVEQLSPALAEANGHDK